MKNMVDAFERSLPGQPILDVASDEFNTGIQVVRRLAILVYGAYEAIQDSDLVALVQQ
jgi:hypothetical protein